MKLEDRTVQRRSTVQGQKVRMGFDADATVHLMGVLTDLYENRPLACIREYATNARDAMIEADRRSEPIHVSLPTTLNPVLSISDTGVGLDAAGIAEVYSQYGASTKRDSNDVNGCLGLGCKAALSYSQQFTVVGVKGGVKTTVLVSRDDDGGGDMTIVSADPTSDPSGVTVQIPCKPGDVYQFETLAAEFFQWWSPGTVMVNGRAPEAAETTRITARVHTRAITRTYGEQPRRDLLVMGGVPYPCRLDIDMPAGVGFVCFVPLGEATFVPSREALRDTKRTKDTLASLKNEYAAEVLRAAQDAVDACATKPEALRTALDRMAQIPSRIWRPLNYKGVALPETMTGKYVLHDRSGSLGNGRPSGAISALSATVSLFVRNYAPGSFTPTHRKKADLWLETKAPAHIDSAVYAANGVRYLVMLPQGSTFDTSWIDPARIIEWADLAALKLPRTKAQQAASGGAIRISGSYDVAICRGGAVTSHDGLPACDFPDDLTVIYSQERAAACYVRAKALATAGADNFLMVCLGANRVGKFTRDFPKAQTYRAASEAAYRRWAASLPRDVRDALAVRETTNMALMAELAPARVDDPAVKRAIKLTKVDVSAHEKQRQAFAGLGVEPVDLGGTKVEDVMDPYPLFDTQAFTWYRKQDRTIERDHSYRYLNMIYAANLAARKAA